jgi:uncharacterized alpha-E superfamily protein
MLSRVADSLYWMSRYLERAEHTARLLAVHLNLVLDLPETTAETRRAMLMDLLGGDEAAAVDDDDALFTLLTFDLQNPNSILGCVRAARENARQVREQINLEMWQELNELYLMLGKAQGSKEWAERNVELCEEVIERAQLFAGITDGTMLHGQGWHFIRLGCHLERANASARLLAAESRVLWAEQPSKVYADQPVFLEWLALLRAHAAFEAYSKVYTFDLQPALIAEFLLLNREFPRSLASAAAGVQEALTAIAEATGAPKSNRASRIAGRLRASLDYSDIQEVVAGGIADFLAQLQAECHRIHEAVNQLYITYPIEEKLVL